MQHIIKHLFHVGTLEEVPREKLEALVEEYPSFGMARYLLSRKLRAGDAAHFVEETKKTNLYFTNPFWLQWLLENADGKNGATTARADNLSAQEIVREEEVAEVIAPQAEEAEETVTPEAAAVEEPLPFHSVAMAEEVFQEHSFVEKVEKVENVDGTAAAVAALFEQPAAAAEEPAPPAVIDETPALVDETPAMVAEAPAVVVEAPAVVAEEAAPLSLPEVRTEVRTEQVEEEPIFQSYHTIDYFASQGIKLSLDENPTDRLGKQMKSFTEWLKVMKRIPQQDIKIVPDIVAETRIQAEAAHSIEGREVVTEAMAEVLLKQGMREKAAEVYRKLSLLNPDKSSYFATKIEQLKEF